MIARDCVCLDLFQSPPFRVLFHGLTDWNWADQVCLEEVVQTCVTAKDMPDLLLMEFSRDCVIICQFDQLCVGFTSYEHTYVEIALRETVYIRIVKARRNPILPRPARDVDSSGVFIVSYLTLIT